MELTIAEQSSIFSSFAISSFIVISFLFYQQIKRFSNKIFGDQIIFPTCSKWMSRTKLLICAYFMGLLCLTICYSRTILSAVMGRGLSAFIPHFMLIWRVYAVKLVDIWKLILVFALYFIFYVTGNIIFLLYVFITSIFIFFDLIPNIHLQKHNLIIISSKLPFYIVYHAIVSLFKLIACLVFIRGTISIFLTDLGLFISFYFFTIFHTLSDLKLIHEDKVERKRFGALVFNYLYIIQASFLSLIGIDIHFKMMNASFVVFVIFDSIMFYANFNLVFEYQNLILLKLLRRKAAVISTCGMIDRIPATATHRGETYFITKFYISHVKSNGSLIFDQESRIADIGTMWLCKMVNYVMLPPNLKHLRFVNKIREIHIDQKNRYFRDSDLFLQKYPLDVIRCNNFKSMRHINVRETVRIIRKFSFARTNLSSISLPSSVIRIEDSAFDNCCNMARFSISKEPKLEYIGRMAFYRCSELSEIYFPGSLRTIDILAFDSCTGLKKITFVDKSKVNILSDVFFNVHPDALIIDKAIKKI